MSTHTGYRPTAIDVARGLLQAAEDQLSAASRGDWSRVFDLGDARDALVAALGDIRPDDLNAVERNALATIIVEIQALDVRTVSFAVEEAAVVGSELRATRQNRAVVRGYRPAGLNEPAAIDRHA